VGVPLGCKSLLGLLSGVFTEVLMIRGALNFPVRLLKAALIASVCVNSPAGEAPGPEPLEAKWIWIAGEASPVNFHLAARKVFKLPEEFSDPRLRITADCRYMVFLNGKYLGRGPIRSWPQAYHYDQYDLTGYVHSGANVIAVIVEHYGIATFQVVAARAGLLAELSWESGGKRFFVGTDESWEVQQHPAFSRRTPRIACQQGWVEHFDARKDIPDWMTRTDTPVLKGRTSVIGEPGCKPWTKLLPSPLRHLTMEPVLPVRVCSARLVVPPTATWALDLRPNLLPGYRDANPRELCGLVVTTVTVPEETSVTFHHRGGWTGVNGKLRVNGVDVKPVRDPWAVWLGGYNLKVKLNKGVNLLVWDVTGRYHEWSLNMGITASRLIFPVSPFGKAESFVTYGPFPDRNHAVFKKVWAARKVEDLPEEGAKPVKPLNVYEAHVFHAVAWAKPAEGAPPVESLQRICAVEDECAVIKPPPPGRDVEITLDFGRMTVGFLSFAVDAPEGTVLDFLGFEGYQDGKPQLPGEMVNGMRYTCREGYQSFLSTVRRGFRYLILTLRNVTRPVKIYYVKTFLNTYPLPEEGAFRCNDELLNSIWRMGRYTTRLCSEDTFVDCPTYEQTFWVGDSRNEGLVNYAAFGAYDLSRRCLVLAGRSLDRSAVVECQVPSGWREILTAWSLLWALACDEYYQFTGDLGFLQEIYPRMRRQAKNFAAMRDGRGLLVIRAWNMLDWAPMDTPRDGVVTHQNALLVESWRRTARLARVLGEDGDAAMYLRWAAELKEAINRHLWNEQKRAYVDCLRPDGSQSPTISQQTNVMVYLTDCATPERRRIIARYVEEPPKGFVQAGSPFMMFFIFEALASMGRFEKILQLSRSKWGFMLEKGSTTCWETFPRPGHLHWTRSWCHAWSAAPTYFLSAYQLGVRPASPGFRTVLVAPQPGDLKWAEGRVPTPKGPVGVAWRRESESFRITVEIPQGLRARIEIPAPYKPSAFPRLSLKEGSGQCTFGKEGDMWVISLSGPKVTAEVGR